MIPFKETILSKEELINAVKEGYNNYRAGIITKNDFCMFFGFSHGEAITKFYDGNFGQLLVDGGFNPGSEAYFNAGVRAWINLKDGKYSFPALSIDPEKNNTNNNNNSLQLIIYGAPGTGKSYSVKKITEGCEVIRTTFHPDSDYSTFVGCYKPETDDNGKVSYAFTQQAFTEAYIKAWKQLACTNTSPAASTSSPQPFTSTIVMEYGKCVISKDHPFVRIESIDDKSIDTYKEAVWDKKNIKKVWEDLWESGQYIQPEGERSGKSVQEAVCKYLHEGSIGKDGFEEGWDIIPEEDTPAGKYTISRIGDDKLLVKSIAKNNIGTIKKYFSGDSLDKAKAVQRRITEILHSLGNDFEGALARLKSLVGTTEQDMPDISAVADEDEENEDAVSEQMAYSPVYLVIEEINRGNCAQIFGDLFQLLDRNKEGFSEYPIHADKDLAKELKKEFADVDFSMVEDWIDSQYIKDYPKGVISSVKSGELLIIPSSLNLVATMNTSDQSLFPMDSAFKRRWDWQYVRINQGQDDDNNDLNWIIKAGGEEYRWWTFVTEINKVIAKVTSSADKKLGFFFCKADAEGEIKADKFVNKVIFYLWNEVFKDYDFDEIPQDSVFTFTKKGSKDEYLEFDDFFKDGTDDNGKRVTVINEETVKHFLWKDKSKEEPVGGEADAQAESVSDTVETQVQVPAE